ncbi:hypothetical protein KP509_38G011700 [Ceratopteris richardii]|uniref:Uncharacterized protein n=1 Tax=Ceratopteris richardii TaxID=49495 RepID=A0A8T2Q2D5_CERRI|nr:hypothetical protein KP509_38G011700 [Ceratopteris richardii]
MLDSILVDKLSLPVTSEVMIFQAASLIRFHACKHLSGTSGHQTMNFRIIVGFQPSHTCQAEYFRHLLKPVK